MTQEEREVARGRLELELNNLNNEINSIAMNIDLKEYNSW